MFLIYVEPRGRLGSVNSKSVRVLALASVISIAGCGDDVTGTDNLSEAEAQELAFAVLTAAFSSWSQVPVEPMSAAGPALVPYSYSETWEGTAPCAAGGTVAIDASFDASGDDETGAATIEMSLTQVHSACVVETAEGTFTLTGNPNVGVDLSIETEDGEALSFDGDIVGALDWQHDGRSGSCAIAYTFSANFSATGIGSFSVNGNVCGTSVQQEFTYGTT
jgi:hypothetical protein